ncbi:hypothetical protein Ppa06_26270 [Planomonospora parontospora subsp. parontospora]|uniref:Uncharacterized protein n=2 Tax=Planomonospora parontospora TaxID=58119 RepID=A0AA37F3Q4_9ACTN|nr:hypothetical protein [Planomonospora parontospora]GGK59981.1 hypothetical protein GCM10010126_19410 [Planomonospora parontospora]GII08829.1 hypothetical protein Ppa06_26270 [Planomonospora parontospora subsp. parontospora]
MATSPERISAQRSIAAHRSWAQTAVRSERTAAATAASPVYLDYWIKKIEAEGKVRGKAHIRAAAESARTAWRKQNALKSAESRRRKSAEKQARIAKLRSSGR